MFKVSDKNNVIDVFLVSLLLLTWTFFKFYFRLGEFFFATCMQELSSKKNSVAVVLTYLINDQFSTNIEISK